MSGRITQLLGCTALTLGWTLGFDFHLALNLTNGNLTNGPASTAYALAQPNSSDASSGEAGMLLDEQTAATTGNSASEPADAPADDPASLDVEFDIGDMEDFDSEDFDLSAVDPEADAALQGTVQTVLIAAAAVLSAILGVVLYLRSKRKRG